MSRSFSAQLPWVKLRCLCVWRFFFSPKAPLGLVCFLEIFTFELGCLFFFSPVFFRQRGSQKRKERTTKMTPEILNQHLDPSAMISGAYNLGDLAFWTPLFAGYLSNGSGSCTSRWIFQKKQRKRPGWFLCFFLEDGSPIISRFHSGR